MSDLREHRNESDSAERGNYVLIAMPNLNRAAAHKAALSTTGLEATLVRDGEEARREIARQGPPILLILDLSLPKVDGFELLRELRKVASASESAAIVVSGHAPVRAAARRMAEPLGISRILPFDTDRPVLKEAIEATLSETRRPRPTPPPPRAGAEKPQETSGTEQVIENAVLAVAQRFRHAITVAYVKIGTEERVRGYFSFSDLTGTVNAAHGLAFLRKVAAGSDPLIVPNVASYAAMTELAPGGLPLVRGFAATPLTGQGGDITGALCIMDTKVLHMDATELETLETMGRELGTHLAAQGENLGAATPSAAVSKVDIDSLERLASSDPLTGLSNRRGGEKDIAAEISRARRQNTPLSCLLVDLDHFKDVNDTYGHQTGDYVLREISALLRRTLRAYDILIRWGGEEFLAVLPGVEHEQAFKLGERVRLAVENLRLAGIPGVTASVAVAPLGSDYSFEAMFAAADRQLYRAKGAGRNCVA
jgi:diguanylate cyclase (GGDEF)-like protein